LSSSSSSSAAPSLSSVRAPQLQLNLQYTTGDGHCLLHAIWQAFNIYNYNGLGRVNFTPEYFRQIRQQIAEAIQTRIDDGVFDNNDTITAQGSINRFRDGDNFLEDVDIQHIIYYLRNIDIHIPDIVVLAYNGQYAEIRTHRIGGVGHGLNQPPSDNNSIFIFSDTITHYSTLLCNEIPNITIANFNSIRGLLNNNNFRVQLERLLDQQSNLVLQEYSKQYSSSSSAASSSAASLSAASSSSSSAASSLSSFVQPVISNKNLLQRTMNRFLSTKSSKQERTDAEILFRYVIDNLRKLSNNGNTFQERFLWFILIEMCGDSNKDLGGKVRGHTDYLRSLLPKGLPIPNKEMLREMKFLFPEFRHFQGIPTRINNLIVELENAFSNGGSFFVSTETLKSVDKDSNFSKTMTKMIGPDIRCISESAPNDNEVIGQLNRVYNLGHLLDASSKNVPPKGTVIDPTPITISAPIPGNPITLTLSTSNQTGPINTLTITARRGNEELFRHDITVGHHASTSDISGYMDVYLGINKSYKYNNRKAYISKINKPSFLEMFDKIFHSPLYSKEWNDNKVFMTGFLMKWIQDEFIDASVRNIQNHREIVVGLSGDLISTLGLLQYGVRAAIYTANSGTFDEPVPSTRKTRSAGTAPVPPAPVQSSQCSGEGFFVFIHPPNNSQMASNNTFLNQRVSECARQKETVARNNPLAQNFILKGHGIFSGMKRAKSINATELIVEPLAKKQQATRNNRNNVSVMTQPEDGMFYVIDPSDNRRYDVFRIEEDISPGIYLVSVDINEGGAGHTITFPSQLYPNNQGGGGPKEEAIVDDICRIFSKVLFANTLSMLNYIQLSNRIAKSNKNPTRYPFTLETLQLLKANASLLTNSVYFPYKNSDGSLPLFYDFFDKNGGYCNNDTFRIPLYSIHTELHHSLVDPSNFVEVSKEGRTRKNNFYGPNPILPNNPANNPPTIQPQIRIDTKNLKTILSGFLYNNNYSYDEPIFTEFLETFSRFKLEDIETGLDNYVESIKGGPFLNMGPSCIKYLYEPTEFIKYSIQAYATYKNYLDSYTRNMPPVLPPTQNTGRNKTLNALRRAQERKNLLRNAEYVNTRKAKQNQQKVSGYVTPQRLLKGTTPPSTGSTNPKTSQSLNNSFSSEIGSVTGSVSNNNKMYFRLPPKLPRGFIPLPIIPSISPTGTQESPTGTQNSPTSRKRKTRKNRNKNQRKTRRR